MINEDYTDFVSLSTQLVNVDGAVARMQMPLTDLRVPLPAWSPSPSGPYQKLSAAPRAARHPHGSVCAGGASISSRVRARRTSRVARRPAVV